MNNMGMFDTITVTPDQYCARCGELLTDWQSKDAECNLDTISFWRVNNFYTHCNKCNAQVNRWQAYKEKPVKEKVVKKARTVKAKAKAIEEVSSTEGTRQEAGAEPPRLKIESGELSGDENNIRGIRMIDNAERRKEIDMPNRTPMPETVEQWKAKAEAEIKNGYIYPPSKPGIGVEINEEQALKHPFELSKPVQWFHEDGSVADW